jgi:predicted DNA-binding transcriptional regulator AlpA
VLLQLNELGNVEPIYSWRDARPLFGGISRTTAWRMVRAGQLPRPVQISPGRVGWRHTDVQAYQSKLGGLANAA